jgi:DedD protein
VLLVVFVPMLIDSEPRPVRNEPALAIPPKENAPALPAPAGSRAAPAQKSAEAPKPAEPKASDSKTAESRVLAPEPPKAQRVPQEQAPRSAPAPKLEGFAVQVGAFRDEVKLAQARDKLKSAGIAHYTERLDSSTGELTRLRVGPFPTREAAEASLTKLRGLTLEGKVVPLS